MMPSIPFSSMGEPPIYAPSEYLGNSLFPLATLLSASEDFMSFRLISFPQVLLPPREGEVSWGWSETAHSHLLLIR